MGACLSKQQSSSDVTWWQLLQAARTEDVPRLRPMLAKHRSTGDALLRCAAADGDEECLRMLLAASGCDAPPEAADSCGVTALQAAAQNGRLSCLRILIEGGADTRAADADGLTALHKAAVSTSPSAKACMLALLSARARIDAADRGGATALHAAAGSGAVRNLSALLAAGASVAAADSHGTTPLHHAARHGCGACLRLLLAAGAAADAADVSSATALHYAARGGHADCISGLLAAGASLAAVNKRGWTALHVAAQHNKLEAIRSLVLGGTDPAGAIGSKERRSPAQMAAEAGHTDAVDLLMLLQAQLAAQLAAAGSTGQDHAVPAAGKSKAKSNPLKPAATAAMAPVSTAGLSPAAAASWGMLPDEPSTPSPSAAAVVITPRRHTAGRSSSGGSGSSGGTLRSKYAVRPSWHAATGSVVQQGSSCKAATIGGLQRADVATPALLPAASGPGAGATGLMCSPAKPHGSVSPLVRCATAPATPPPTLVAAAPAPDCDDCALPALMVSSGNVLGTVATLC